MPTQLYLVANSLHKSITLQSSQVANALYRGEPGFVEGLPLPMVGKNHSLGQLVQFADLYICSNSFVISSVVNITNPHRQ